MSHEPILVIMAAGMGSRYGGLKQIDGLGPSGEILMEYSVYDAIRAGFKRFVFIVGEEIELFREVIGSRIKAEVEKTYVAQSLEDLPEGFKLPEGRVKPWGTGHAILAARKVIDAPFAVINADDFYGPEAYQLAYDYLSSQAKSQEALLVNYVLGKTLSKHGYVTRGLCKINSKGQLEGIEEAFRIVDKGERATYSQDGGKTWQELDKSMPCSMNFWGFAPDFMQQLADGFTPFLEDALEQNPLKAEYLLPQRVGELIAQDELSVFCRQSNDQWFGVTYSQDKAHVHEALTQMMEDGEYPRKLWE